MSRSKSLAKGSERVAGEIADVLELRDPRKATRNAAIGGLVGGALGASALAQAAGVMSFFNPIVTLGLFVMLTVALPLGWEAGSVDVRLAVRMFELHRRTREGRLARAAHERAPVYFCLRLPSEITPVGTAKMAFEPYSLSLSIGTIAWSSAIGIAPGGAPLTAPSAVLAMSVALASLGATLVATWVVPPLWLLKTSGLRVLDPREGQVSRVDQWYNAVFGPVMGVAALGTLFIVFAIGGIGLHPAVFSFVSISIALYPIAFAATYLYRTRREAKAAGALAARLKGLGLPTYARLDDAFAASTGDSP